MNAGDDVTTLPLCAQLLVPSQATVLAPSAYRAPDAFTAITPGRDVVLVARGTVQAMRLHCAARRLNLLVDRDVVVLPSLERPWCCVELGGGGPLWLWQTMGTVPPGRTWSAPILDLAIRAGRRSRLVGILACLAPCRVLIARGA